MALTLLNVLKTLRRFGYKMWGWFFSTTLLEILLSPTNMQRVMLEVHAEMRVRFSIKVPLYLSVINKKMEGSNRFLEKSRNVRFHENPFSWSRGVTYAATHRQTERWTDRTTRKCEQMNFGNYSYNGLNYMATFTMIGNISNKYISYFLMRSLAQQSAWDISADVESSRAHVCVCVCVCVYTLLARQ